MDGSGDVLYQVVRFLFALSLLGFLFLVIRQSLRELQQPLPSSVATRTPPARAELFSLHGEEGCTVDEGLVFGVQGVATIGRGASAKIVLDDTSVSAQHALVRWLDDRWVIEDLGSRNGTLVNGRLITGQWPLTCGDGIQLGRVQLRLMC